MKYVGQELPPIHDFYLESKEGEDLTTQVLEEEKIMLIVIHNISKSDRNGFANIKMITDKALKNNYKVYALSTSL